MTMCGCKFYLLMLIMNFDWIWTLDYPMKTKVRHLDVRCFETLISTRGGTMCFWNYGRHRKEWCFFRTLITTARGTIFCFEPWSAQKEEQCFFGTLISTRGGMVFFQNWLLNHWGTIKYHLITLFNNLSLWNWIFL